MYRADLNGDPPFFRGSADGLQPHFTKAPHRDHIAFGNEAVGLGAERVIQLRFARSDDLRCARTAEREALGHDTVEPQGGDRAADLLRLLLRRFERGERDLLEMQPRPACVRQVLQDVGQDVARDEKVAAARGYVDIADGFPLDAAAHQRAEKIAVRERVALKKSGAHGGDRTILARQPILVQIVRQVAADLALRRGKPAEEADRRAAQHLANEHLFPLREEIRRRRMSRCTAVSSFSHTRTSSISSSRVAARCAICSRLSMAGPPLYVRSQCIVPAELTLGKSDKMVYTR